jgi:RHS repeat-associated protein
MGTSSARPDDLDRFAHRSRSKDEKLRGDLERVRAFYHAFHSENHWGSLQAGSLLHAYGDHLDGNEFTARWVAQIAATFRAAGASGRLVRLPDRAIKASLRGAGLDHHRRPVKFDDPVAFGTPSRTGYADDPINTASGNFVEVETDLACSGLVEGMTFKRTYNSRSDRVGAFGRGWSSWAGVRLLARSEGVGYVGPDGQEATFPRMGHGYGRVIGVDALVESLESGLALRWLGGGERWVFDDAGLLVEVSRGPGTEIVYRHDDGRLVELVHPGGRSVCLEWDEGAERIAGLACSDGRTVTYRYDAGGNLVEVDGAAGPRCYELDELGRVVSVIDADGVVELVNTYDEDGSVLEQLSPFGRRTYLSYLPGGVTITSDDDEDGPINTYIHDAAGRLLAVVDGDDRQLSTVYDDWGNIVSVTERDGAVTVQEYDERSRPVRRVLATGATFTFAYDDANRLVEVATGAGAVTRYRYDGDERIPSEIADAEGGVTRQVVRGGLVRRVVDPDGVSVDLEQDADGNVIAATDAGGNVARLERDAAGRVIAVVSPLGRRTAVFYDQSGRIAERHDAAGGVWRYEHTAAGRLASVTDPAGGREQTRYGEHGLAAATIDALGHVTSCEYDRFSNLVGVVEPDGARWRYEYDAVMRLTATVDPTGGRWAREYDANGTLVATVDPTGVRVSASTDAFGRVVGIDDGMTCERFELDELGRVVAELGADDSATRYGYDRCDRMTSIEDATGAVTRLEYTPGGRLARRLYPSGRLETFEYDVCGRIAARVDGAGRRWELRYDADGELVERRLPTGEVERLEYDDAARLTSASIPGAGLTRCEYDSAGRVVAVNDRDAGSRRFAYDAGGRVVEAIDANGGVTRYAYNERGWLTGVTDPLGATVTGRHDAVGRVIGATDQLGRTSTLAYDPAGRLIEQVDGSGRCVRRSYDRAGRPASFGAPGLEPVTIGYDALGRVTSVAEPGAPVTKLAWDAEGRLVERARGDLAMRWAFDADGERLAVGYPDGSQTRYERDAGGYVVGLRHPGVGAIELQRDAAGRLVGASADGMRALWRYEDGDLERYEMRAGGRLRTAQLARDPIGRVVQATIDGAAHTLCYDRAGQLVGADTPLGSYEFVYDANGRLAHERSPAGILEYEYDAAGQLAVRTAGDGAVTSFEYDGAGRRVRECGVGLERRYRWDELGRLTAVAAGGDDNDVHAIDVVVDALGELASVNGRPLLWDSAHPLQPLTWNGEASVLGENGPWALAGRDSARWLAPDWQGTIGETPRDLWGAPLGQRADRAAIALGYRGELEIGTDTWLRNRIYQPASRAFLQPDPLPPLPASATAANPYHYAANNTITLSDPLGLRPLSDKELKALRDRMDRDWGGHLADAGKWLGTDGLDAVKDVAKYAWDHPGETATLIGIGALSATGVTEVAIGAVALGLSARAAYTSINRVLSTGKDPAGAILDVVSLFPGAGAVIKGIKAIDVTRDAGRLAGLADDAARSGAAKGGGYNPHAVKASRLQGVSEQRVTEAHRLERQVRKLNVTGIGLGGVGAARTHLPKVGIDHPPLTVPPGLLTRPNVSLASTR